MQTPQPKHSLEGCSVSRYHGNAIHGVTHTSLDVLPQRKVTQPCDGTDLRARVSVGTTETIRSVTFLIAKSQSGIETDGEFERTAKKNQA